MVDFERFWNPGAEFEKKSGKKLQSGFAPLVMPIGPGASVLTKMFGTAKAAPQVASKGFPWLVVGGGAVAGFGASMLFGKKGQEQAVAQELKQDLRPEFKPETVWNIGRDKDPFYDMRTTNQYDIITGSPGSSIYSEKKAEMGGSTPTWSQPEIFTMPTSASGSQAAEQGQTEGTDLTMIAVIAAIGLVAYGFVSKKGAKRK